MSGGTACTAVPFRMRMSSTASWSFIDRPPSAETMNNAGRHCIIAERGLLEHESQAGLHAACVGAVRETLRLGAVADVGDAVGDHRPQDAKGSRVHLGIDGGVVLRVERIEGLEHQDRLYTLAE